MTGAYDFDNAGRLTGMSYTDAALATIRSFAWSYDAAHRIIGHESDIAAEDVADDGYAYDATNQLTGANYTDAGRDDEAYAYDENGNRTGANGETYTTGDNNQTTGDGVYRYLFDDEGNRIARFVDEDSSGTLTAGDTDVTQYSWDHRNRLTEVAHRAVFGGAVDWEADYVYDLFDRRIGSLYDDNGDATPDRIERYVWEGRNVALDFVDPDGATGGGQSAPLALATRYLWGPAVDQLLAQETVDNGGPEDVRWPATDNLGSVRSLVDSTGAITATYSYDTFGTVTVLAGSLTDSRYLFTCQEYDLRTTSYYYDARWYDPATGKFVSEDSIGFAGGDANLCRYCSNQPIVVTDPSGLRANWLGDIWRIVDEYWSQLTAAIAMGADTGALMDASIGRIECDASAFGQMWYKKTQNNAWWSNAARHGYWQAMLTFKYGELDAQIIGDAHEIARPGDDLDTIVDKYNNPKARQIGKRIRRLYFKNHQLQAGERPNAAALLPNARCLGKPKLQTYEDLVRREIEKAMHNGRLITDPSVINFPDE